LRFETSRDEEHVSLSTYVSRMPAGQEAIYYVIGESKAQVAGSPHLEALKQRGYEVLYLTDPVDEWAVNGLREFEGKKLVSAMHAELKLNQTEEQKKEQEQQAGTLKPLLDRMQEVLKEHVREVRASSRLTDSPVCLVLPEGASHAHVERLLRERGRGMPRSKRILEVNPAHPLIGNLKALLEKDGQSAQVKEWIELLHDQALLTEGGRVDDPNLFAKRVTALLSQVAANASGAPKPNAQA
jgi:molecular chaperone HtpG